MAVIATLNTVFSATTAGFDAAVSRSRKTLGGFQSAIFSVKGALASLGVSFGAISGAKWIVGVTASMEQLETSFAVMLGSGAKAKELLEDLNKFAAVTPFETVELADATKKLLAFGVAQEQIIPTMTRIGDISAGLGIPISELAELYGKAKVQGRLFAEDVNQLTGRGIPVIQQFAKQFGVADGSVRKLVETGKIGFPQLEQAFKDLTAEGSMFGGGMEKQSQTLSGLWSTFTDEINMAAASIGTSLLPVIKAVFEQIMELTKAATAWVSSVTSASESGTNAMQMFASSVGVVADVVDVLMDGFQFLQAGVTGVIGAILTTLAQLVKGIQEVINATGIMKVAIGDTLTAIAEGVVSQAEKEWEEAKQSFAAPPPSVGITKFFDEIRAKSRAASEAMAADSGKMSGASANAAHGWNLFVGQLKGFEKFASAAADKGAKLIAEQAKSIKESTRTPLEEFNKTMQDLESLKSLGAIDEKTFLRAQAAELNKLDKATDGSASKNKNAALERGTAAAFAAERSGKDSPLKTQKDILEQAKRQTAIQEEQLAAFKEGGAVPVNF